ncbi:GNAT family N-acetyltransferase [Oleiagrimonas sp. C23AA]|uniref:GNAT family N-acetyltransferase n=1 Tax=Oleiagrimonas sp. C23AA TaxID=2719047 RepID=UPI001421F7C8|nr:GNAT family N-acetyltransferase [Oleiagrimonas sp. C23AA]NII10543.1 N-acetyltransferase [Oleiagrimonas sp. C23AA]
MSGDDTTLTARFHKRLDAIDADTWDSLGGDANPFVSHAFLSGLERTGCIRAEWGWQPHHLGLYRGDTLVAAAPLYLKGNSHGEYVFDWGWADAWERAGGNYYPKLLCAVPYSPVPGPRLLVGNGDDAEALRRELVTAIQAETLRRGLSSAHVNFIDRVDDRDAFGADWLSRFDYQYHWHNRGYADFDAFLGALNAKKRKNIRHERRDVAASGLACDTCAGDALSEAEWDRIHALYLNTFDEKGNHAALSRDFFAHLAHHMGDRVQVALARRDGDIVAMALLLTGNDTLYGRYWGAIEEVPSLHFELCYYRGIELCIERGLARFEPGAQGRHKMARGFLPVATHSRHYLPHPEFREAVDHALTDEAQYMHEHYAELMQHSPYAQR